MLYADKSMLHLIPSGSRACCTCRLLLWPHSQRAQQCGLRKASVPLWQDCGPEARLIKEDAQDQAKVAQQLNTKPSKGHTVSTSPSTLTCMHDVVR